MNLDQSYYTKVVALADDVAKTWNPKMKWTWGEALLGYALDLLDTHQGTSNYTAFLKSYCDYYVQHQPKVDSSDSAAPGLITYAMEKRTNNPEYKKLTDKVIDYILHEPRLIEDSVNHLGSSFLGKFYPKSIWVDSLMMFSVFPAVYAKDHNDQAMMEIAARQPRILAKYLQDPKDGLWYHSYWVKQHTHYPRKKIYWGRGNGWVIAALPMILEAIGEHEEKENIVAMLRKTSEALLPYQRTDGAFETVINKVGKTYRELSFTALVAFGWMKAVRLGYLDKKYLEPALKAYQCVVDALEFKNDHVYMPEISGPTTPLPLFPYLGYAWLPKKRNWSYGIAPLVYAAIEFDQIAQKH